ncbi:nuclear transport factor 2 family protein [Actinomadura verrucosospora]|uniref:Aromatic-ring-hydroxylating dioxygenase subunit beta n=1 Tax=Actinomadura verrucosospora TaxID=46165 RepID=A0A7D4AN57_ACTVE|nr:nuclear transport factor 2 family protein [Actinomadura verrucosospora]QKG20929.1 aromatic-ring-hydroxylating dioxygenase subunit beta [Actinomadura verrucosospora]
MSDALPADQAVRNLIFAYAEAVDGGDFAAVGALFAHGDFVSSGATLTGGAVARMFEKTIILYDDGTPRTKHVTTNVAVELDAASGTAAAKSYFTVMQATPELPFQAICAGRYDDRFEQHDGHWRFAERRITLELVGNVAHHLSRPDKLPAHLRP